MAQTRPLNNSLLKTTTITHLPVEIIYLIFKEVATGKVVIVALRSLHNLSVCKQWHTIATDDLLWREVYSIHYNLENSEYTTGCFYPPFFNQNPQNPRRLDLSLTWKQKCFTECVFIDKMRCSGFLMYYTMEYLCSAVDSFLNYQQDVIEEFNALVSTHIDAVHTFLEKVLLDKKYHDAFLVLYDTWDKSASFMENHGFFYDSRMDHPPSDVIRPMVGVVFTGNTLKNNKPAWLEFLKDYTAANNSYLYMHPDDYGEYMFKVVDEYTPEDTELLKLIGDTMSVEYMFEDRNQ